MEREVGGGIGMGKTCKLKDVSFQCMTKFTTKKKIKNKREKKKKKKTKKSPLHLSVLSQVAIFLMANIPLSASFLFIHVSVDT